MDGLQQQGSSQGTNGADRLNVSLRNLYEIGPLRFGPRTLKTAQAFISRKNLCHNARIIKNYCDHSVKLCAVVKADAYGHHALSIVQALNAAPIDAFAVASVDEAQSIFPFSAGKPILVMGPLFAGISRDSVRLAQARSFHCTVCSSGALDYLQSILDTDLPRLNVHLKIDTGMGRLGCSLEDAEYLVRQIIHAKGLRLAGVYTHFATADEPDAAYAFYQLGRFQDFLTRTGLDRDSSVVQHAANTSAVLKIPSSHFNMIRCGIGLYGYTRFPSALLPHTCSRQTPGPQSRMSGRHFPTPDTTASVCSINLRPVLKVMAPVVQVKRLERGQPCGYGRTFFAARDSIIGIVSVGYADGLFSRLSNRACMRSGRHDLPIIGRVSMDMTAIDLTDFPQPSEGMAVTVIDNDPESGCSAANLARLAGVSCYEVLTAIGNRIKRSLVD